MSREQVMNGLRTASVEFCGNPDVSVAFDDALQLALATRLETPDHMRSFALDLRQRGASCSNTGGSAELVRGYELTAETVGDLAGEFVPLVVL